MIVTTLTISLEKGTAYPGHRRAWKTILTSRRNLVIVKRVMGNLGLLRHIQCLAFLMTADISPCCLDQSATSSKNEVPRSNIVEEHPIMEFRRFSNGLIRMKRDWIIPPNNIPENDRGPYPKFMVQIKSNNAKKVPIMYKITGPGVDEPPEGLFTFNSQTGSLFVTKALDREKQDEYQLWAHALSEGINVEEPTMLIIRVIDQNDNRPEFPHQSLLGRVNEACAIDHSVMSVKAMDRDDPNTENAIVRYRIQAQVPTVPQTDMFAINPVSGIISVVAAGLDRETHPEYKLVIEAADMEGSGLSASCTVIITVTDSNDHAPQFIHPSISTSVPENSAGVEVAKLTVNDFDELGSPNANTKYSIVKGNRGALFNIRTGPSKMEGILTAAKALDFESVAVFTLMVVVENEVAFTGPVTTSTATVTVRVEDQNEPPVFNPAEIHVLVSEDLPVGSTVSTCRAEDPDTARRQTVGYKLRGDMAKWLSINKESGLVKTQITMDRESIFVKNGKYTVLILASDNDTVPATGTGTLVVTLWDVNDNAPLIRQRKVSLCSVDPAPVLLDIMDKDGPGNTGPYTVELQGQHRANWTISTNTTRDEAALVPKRALSPGDYSVVMRIYDAQMLFQDSTLEVEVCQCQGALSTCFIPHPEPRAHVPSVTTGVLGAIFAVLLLLLLLLLWLGSRRSVKALPLLEDVDRGNIFYYHEEGGGEEDQKYDLSQLHRGLDNRPVVFYTDVVPAAQTHSLYRLQPQENEDIGNFIKDNLRAADSDPSAPPYDCLLVFDYEGAGSDAGSTAGSLSSLNSSGSEGERVFHSLALWGPLFSRLADLFASWAEDDDDSDEDTLPGKTEWV